MFCFVKKLAVQPHADNRGGLRAGDIHSKKNKLDGLQAEGQLAKALRQEMPGVQRTTSGVRAVRKHEHKEKTGQITQGFDGYCKDLSFYSGDHWRV